MVVIMITHIDQSFQQRTKLGFGKGRAYEGEEEEEEEEEDERRG
jgi:hypothetical protein